LPMASGNDGGNRNFSARVACAGRATPAARPHCTGMDGRRPRRWRGSVHPPQTL